MDDALVHNRTIHKFRFRTALILVVMDDALVPFENYIRLALTLDVLILVVMDDALVPIFFILPVKQFQMS